MSIKGDLIFASVAIPPVGGGYYTRLIYRSTDGGTTWDLLDTNLIHRSASITILNGNPPKLIGAINSRLYYSDDLGVTWDSTQQNNPPLFRFHDKGNVPGLVFGIGESFYSQDRLFRSTDYGRTWTEPYPFPASSDGSDHAIGMSTRASDMYVNDYTNIGGNFFYHSKDNGETWNYVGIPRFPVSGAVQDIVVDIDDPSILYIANGGRLQRSADAGANWAILFDNYPSRTAYSLIQDSLNSDFMIMFTYGNMKAVNFSTDRGKTWMLDTTSSVLPYKYEYNGFQRSTWFEYDGKKDRLYIATKSGIWIRDQNVTDIATLDATPMAYLIQTYPQPAKSFLIMLIRFRNNDRITVRILNALGKTIREYRDVESDILNWDLRDTNNDDVPSGMYMVVMQGMVGTFTERIIVQRYGN